MSYLPVIVLVGLTLFMWAVAIWASIEEEQQEPKKPTGQKEKKEQKPEPEDHSTDGRKVA